MYPMNNLFRKRLKFYGLSIKISYLCGHFAGMTVHASAASYSMTSALIL